MTTGELEGVFYKSLLLHLHQDPLTAHGTDASAQAPAGHAALVVVLKANRWVIF